MTPCEEAGYKIGEWFLCLENSWAEGEVVYLKRDDLSNAPLFMSAENKVVYESIWNVKKLNVIDNRNEAYMWQNRERKRFESSFKQGFNVVVNDAKDTVTLDYYDTDEVIKAVYQYLPESVYNKMLEYGFMQDGNHFLHIALSDKNLISYTACERSGILDRSTTSKIGRYLSKFSDLTAPQIAEISALYRREVLDQYNIQFARTREEIKHVYLEGPNSCMSHSLSDYKTDGVHPCEIYATPDMSVAFYERDGRITARVVVNEIKKQFVSIYGDVEVLKEGLKAHGYEYGSLEGCSMLLLRNDKGKIIAPYLDGDSTLVDIKDKMLVIDDDGDTEANQQYGLLSHEGTECSDCGDDYDQDDMHYSDYHERYVCNSCIDDYYYAWHGSEQMYVHSDAETVYEYRDDWYTTEGLEYNNLILLEEGDVAEESYTCYSEIDNATYHVDQVTWYTDTDGDMQCTVNRDQDVIEPEDSTVYMLKEDLYEFDSLYYEHEDNMLEAEQEAEDEVKKTA